MKHQTKNKSRRFWQIIKTTHRFYKISGGYRFLIDGFKKLGLILIIFGSLIWLINQYIFDFEAITTWMNSKFHWSGMVLLLGASEIVTGILPPDLFILWASEMESPYLMIFSLASISYVGGILSYLVGQRINHFPRVQRWINSRFDEQSKQLKKFGGLLIFLSALTPLPFPPVCTISGIFNYNFRLFLIISLSRFMRFFLYAIFIFGVI